MPATAEGIDLTVAIPPLEEDLILAWFANGGALMFAVEPGVTPPNMLGRFGVSVPEGMVLDKLLRMGEGRILRRLKYIAEQVNDLEDDFVDKWDLPVRIGGHLVEDMDRVKRTVETDRLRSALLTSISHDLKTPLAGIEHTEVAHDHTPTVGRGAPRRRRLHAQPRGRGGGACGGIPWRACRGDGRDGGGAGGAGPDPRGAILR